MPWQAIMSKQTSLKLAGNFMCCYKYPYGMLNPSFDKPVWKCNGLSKGQSEVFDVLIQIRAMNDVTGWQI